MALITRISRLFQADFHAVLDRIEEPEILLRQAVREMEEDIHQDQQRLKLLSHEQKQLTVRLDETAKAIHQVDEELDVCFASNKDELARVLIRRKLEAQQLSRILQKREQDLTNNITELKKRLAENQAHLAAMQQKLELLAEQNCYSEQGEAGLAGSAETTVVVRDEDVEVAFLREMQKRAKS